MSELRTFEYAHDGALLQGQLALPAGRGPHPAIMVMHDARGLGELPRQRARDLADAGYVALATDMYGEGAYYADPRAGGEAIGRVMANPALLRSRVVSTFDTLRALPEVDSARVGAIGFCFGGQCALELARSGADARAVVSFHGILKTASPAQAGQVRAKALVMTGALDPYAPAEDVAALQAEMAAANADLHVASYSQGYHAFTDPSAHTMTNVPGLRYDPLLAALSWLQATAFLHAVVRVN